MPYTFTVASAQNAPVVQKHWLSYAAPSNPAMALSRGLAGVRKGKLIVNLPGSVRGARESLQSIVDLLPHAVDIAQGRTAHPAPD